MAYIATGLQTIATPGTAVPLLLPDNAAGHSQQVYRAQTVVIQASTANTGNIGIGTKNINLGSGVGVGFVLAPGAISPAIHRSAGGEDTSQLYLDTATGGNKFSALLIAD